MSKIRIAIMSGVFAVLLAGATVGASAAAPSHSTAGPRPCCSKVVAGTH
jgi:hypothetical protein